jgi:heavy metal sensor kinase
MLFATFLYFQLRANLFDQLDTSLQLVASQTAISAELTNGQLAFVDTDTAAEIDFVIFLTAVDGTVWDKTGRNNAIQPLQPFQPGLTTMLIGDDHWRVFSQKVTEAGTIGYIQVIGDIDPISDTLDRLLTLILIGGPLTLILAGLGGVFLASRALRPIDRMTQTAQTISASDLNRRIEYVGPADEVGRLAQTFDSMLDRLQTSFERERRFTGDAAHELRTPLAALKGQIGVTLSQSRQPEVYRETLADMKQQVDRLIRLSSDLLFMARLDQGQMTRQMERIDVRDFLGAVVDQIRPLAADKSIALIENTSPDLTIQGDFDLLLRLFLNLLDNAVKYTPENGRVIITAEQNDTNTIISITDTGPGIPPEHLPHLFERFYRVDGGRSRGQHNHNQGGAGLGLSIAYEIARAHSGSLTAQNKLGEGATFIVQLPANGNAAVTT